MEDGCHSTLVRGPCIFKTKWHYSIIEISNWGPEVCFLYILRCHSYLIVPIISIKENMELPAAESTRRSILGKGNSSLGHALLNCKIHTAPYLTILLLYRNYIRKPSGMLDRPDKPYCQ